MAHNYFLRDDFDGQQADITVIYPIVFIFMASIILTSNNQVHIREAGLGLHELPGVAGMEHVVDAVSVHSHRSVG